jgi:hypothetical protein
METPELEEVKAVPLVATKYGGRTIAGIKGKDEAAMWKPGDMLWGEVIEEKRIKVMYGEDADDLDRFVGDCGILFASEEASEQYDAFCDGRLVVAAE